MYKKTEFKNKLASNAAFMMLLQAIQLLMPLILMPFIIKIYGIAAFGLLSFSTAICMLINVVCDYGFNLTATRDISINVKSPIKINQIFNTVFSAKIILLLVTFLLYALSIFTIDKLRSDWLIYILSFGMVIGNVLFPLWLYQGFQNFKIITLLHIVFKILFTVSLFFIINGNNDFYKVPLFLSLGYIVPGIIALFYAKKRYCLFFQFPQLKQLINVYKEGWHIFVSRIAVFSYTSINVIFLEIFTNNIIVGYYAVASRIIGAISSVVGMVNQVLFPYLSVLWSERKEIYFRNLNFIALISSAAMIFIFILMQFISPYVIYLLTGEYGEVSIDIIRILSFALIFFPLGGLFTQSFVTQKENNLVTVVTLKTTLFNFVLIFILTPLYGAYGMAVSVCLVQLFQVMLNLFYMSKLKRKQLCVA